MEILRLGAIDIGANSVKLLIIDVINHENKVVYKTSSFTRIPLLLGEDTFFKGYITDEKIAKLAELVQTFVSLMLISEVKYWSLCATSALREASNVNDVVQYVLSKTGQGIKILSPNDEAYLLNLNLMAESLDEDKIYIIADVGGGCTDISLVKKGKLSECYSFSLGTIRVLSKQAELEEWEKMQGWIDLYCGGENLELVLIGSGGNINKLNSIFKKRGKIKRHDFNNLYKRFKSLPYDERVLNLDLNLNRVRVIVPAMKIYLRLMKILKKDEIIIPVIGLADGIIKDLYLNKCRN